MTPTWFFFPADTDFGPANLPYGIFSTSDRAPRAGLAVGNQVLDLFAAAQFGLFHKVNFDHDALQRATLNDLIACGKTVTNGIRHVIQQHLTDENSPLRNAPRVWVPQASATLHLPVAIGDYTDFYSSIEHATNVGKLFRDPDNALLPNWRHLPVGYHGRASSIVVSGTPIRRPSGQTLPKGAMTPRFGPSQRVDFELEMGFIIGRNNELGQAVSTATAADHIFGLVLFNDWSARDIQQWEYVPLGPFLGKSFASTMSPWVVPLEALGPFRVPGPAQVPSPLPYLQGSGAQNYDITLAVELTPADGQRTVICESNTKYLYWNMAQQLAHHTSNGCNLRVGDLLASGTISGPGRGSYGSLLEISEGGKTAIPLGDQTRIFLEDGDTVTLRAHAGTGAGRVGFGEATGQLLAAIEH